MKSNGKKLIALIIILALAIGLYFGASYLGKQNDENEANEDTQALNAATLETDKVSVINWSNESGDFSIYRKSENNQETWKYLDDKNLPLDQSIPSSQLSACSSVIATRLVDENPSDLNQYELDDKAVSVIFEKSDNTTVTYYFGTTASTGDVYFKTSESAAVYTIGSDIKENFVGDLYSLVEKDTIPSYQVLDKITVTEYDYDEDETEEEKTVITAVTTDDKTIYIYTDGKDKKTSDDNTSSTLESQISSLSFGNCVNYKGEKKKYGLDKPEYKITITGKSSSDDKKSESYTLILGKEAAGDSIYANLKGSKKVYTIAKSDISSLIDIEFDDMKS